MTSIGNGNLFEMAKKNHNIRKISVIVGRCSNKKDVSVNISRSSLNTTRGIAGNNQRFSWFQNLSLSSKVVEAYFSCFLVHTYISITIKKGRFCFTLFLGPKCILSLFMVFRRPKMYLCKRHLALHKKENVIPKKSS